MTSEHLKKIQEYQQPGEKDFPSQHPSLRRHMEAAYQVQQNPPLPNPNVTGTLAAGDMQTLWTIITFVGTYWNIWQYSSLSNGEFQYYMNLKTQQTPSYYTAYRQALALFAQLVQQYGSQQAALVALYSPTPPNPQPPNWDVVRFWVIQEFLTLYVVRGAFRAYGWWLYPGYGGGPFSNPSKLPYRPYRGQ